MPISAIHVLDVGCSNGALGRALRELVPRRVIWGVELDTEFARHAATHLDCVIQADVGTLQWGHVFSGQSFDCVIFADVLEHLPEPGRCLQQVTSLLKPEGCVVISLPNIRHVSALWQILMKGRFPRRDRGIFDRSHLRWFTLNEAKDMLAGAGLRISCINQSMRWGDVGGGLWNRLLNRLPDGVKAMGPIREFLTYQYCLRAERAS